MLLSAGCVLSQCDESPFLPQFREVEKESRRLRLCKNSSTKIVKSQSFCYALILDYLAKKLANLCHNMCMLPYIAYAADSAAVTYAKSLLVKIDNVILFPLISLMMGVAFLMFLYGAFEYVRNADSEQGRLQGRMHLIWGVVGMLIMVSAYGILSIAAGTFGLNTVLQNNTANPNAAAQISPSSYTPTGATAAGSTYQPTNTPYTNSGAAPTTETSSLAPASSPIPPAAPGSSSNGTTQSPYQAAYIELTSNGYTASQAQDTVNTMSNISTPTSLNYYLSALPLSSSTKQQVVQKKFPNQ